MIKKTVRERLLASTMICGAAIAAFAAMPAYAQESQDEGETVVVTGSRIVRQDFEAISPVVTVGSEQLELTGTLSVDALLNELPQVIPGNTKTSNNAGGEDFATVDLRGLGANRTLVLVNGERVPGSSTSGTVDLNTLPASLIDRIEVVTGGASAVYGSDAMAGVVNFILKDNYEGAELSATYGSSWDGKAPNYEINGLFGGNFADGKGNLTAYAAYYQRDKVLQSELDYARVSAAVCADATTGEAIVCDTAAEAAASGGVLFPGGSGTPSWGWIANNPANPFQNLGTLLPTRFGAGTYDTNCDGVANTTAFNSGNLSFNDAGVLTPRQVAGACQVPDRAAGSSRYNFAPDNYLIIPAERFNLTTIGTYDISDNLRAKIWLSYANSRTEVQLAPTPATGLSVTLTPAMQTLIQANAPDLWTALQSRPTPLANFTIDRRMNEVGTRNSEFENSTFLLLSTLEGEINDNWSWSATASYGRSRFDAYARNSVNKTALGQGLAGCQTPTGGSLGAAQLPGCVPLDIFGPNTLTPAMQSFLRINTFTKTEVDQSRVAGFIRGDLFELPAGPVAVVFGAEYREDSATTRVDDAMRNGDIFGFNAVQDQDGSIDVYELYGEASVPLLKDLPFADYLGLEFGMRYSDYSSIGGVETFKVGGEYAPASWLRFRAMYNEATRAPNVFELFQNGDQGFPSYADPCALANGFRSPGNNVNQAQLQAFCIAQGVPAGLYATFAQNNSQVEAFAFGNPDLSPETAETLTLGAVFQPDWFPIGRLRATIDYYDITIEDAISGFGFTSIVQGCFGSRGQGLTGTLDLNSSVCQRINRDPVTGQIRNINTTVGNLSQFEQKGYDVQVDWSHDVGPGRLKVNALMSILDSYLQNGTDFKGYTFGCIGCATPEWRSTVSATYAVGDFTVFLRNTYTPDLIGGSFGEFVEAASYWDTSVRWNATDRIQLTGGINNVFDEMPVPYASATINGQGNIDPQLYRVLGREFFVSARMRF